MNYRKITLPLLALAFATGNGVAEAAQKPKIVVNIVISQMRYDYLEKFKSNFSDHGFTRFINQGVCYNNAKYNYMQTNTIAGLATLSTGTNPASHGIVSENWVDFTTGKVVNLTDDSSVAGLDCEDGEGRYSPFNLTAATIGDRLRESDAKSKIISLASDHNSAIVSGGYSADVYWLNKGQGAWISSSFYFNNLPLWVKKYNEGKFTTPFIENEWRPSRTFEEYQNKECSILNFEAGKKFSLRNFFQKFMKPFTKDVQKYDLAALHCTPAGNSLVTNFARETIVQEELGKDEHTDLLTICYDTPRRIGEQFGPRSIEIEDMFYKLDGEIGEFVNFLYSQFKPEEVVVVLTSSHGSSDTYRENNRVPMGLFNTQQFKMILNGFLSAQYEPGNWVLDYYDRQLYLNRDFIYQYGFNLADVQNRAAAFALQFRGVSAAISSTALQSGYFAGGYGEKMQNSFYPKRSGDVLINLMPGWIEEQEGVLSGGGSLYEYDTHVPLLILGGGIPAKSIDRDVDMTSVAPTLARIMQIPIPNASTGKVLPEVTEN